MTSAVDPQSSAPGPFVSVLTAPGRGAISVVRVWGPGALKVADQAFRANQGKRLGESATGRLRVGRMGAGLGDEVVAVVVGDEFAAGFPEVEIQCHGGSVALAMVVSALSLGGARVRSVGAWARQSSGSRLRGEAWVALAWSSTTRLAEILLDQADGALDVELRGVLEADPAAAIARLDLVIERGKLGIRMVEGWRVVLAGRPNVGKSRLLNALAGYDRAIVDPTPGTTRDVVTARVAFEGWPIELADTAGLRDSIDPIEVEGVALARGRHREADLVVVVLDRSEPLDDLDRAILLDHPRALIVASKSDLPAVWDETSVGAWAVSAESGDGVPGLVARVAGRVVEKVPPEGSAVPFRSLQVRRLREIRRCLIKGQVDRGRGSLARWLG